MILRALKTTGLSPQPHSVRLVSCASCSAEYDVFVDEGIGLSIGDQEHPDLNSSIRLISNAINNDYAAGHMFNGFICDGRNAFPL